MSLEDLTGLVAVMLFLGGPAIVFGMYQVRAAFVERWKRFERAEARKMYERLAHRKLDAVETALALGYTRDEVAALDSRLERLIGTEQMKSLLDRLPTAPEIRDMPDDQVRAEIAAIRKVRE